MTGTPPLFSLTKYFCFSDLIPPATSVVKVSMKADVLTVTEVSPYPQPNPPVEPIVEEPAVVPVEEKIQDKPETKKTEQVSDVTSTGFVSFLDRMIDDSPRNQISQRCFRPSNTTTTTVIVAERPRELPVTVVYQQERIETVKEEPEEAVEVRKEDNKENSRPETKSESSKVS